MLLLISSLIVISFIDYKYMIIPNVFIYSGVIIGLLYAIIFNFSIINSFLGIFISTLLLLVVASILKVEWVMEDVKLVDILCVFLGYK